MRTRGLAVYCKRLALERPLAPSHAGAGEDWDGFVSHCVARDLAGIECLSGIPGWVGGSPVQNIGAYGQEVSESIVRVRAWDRQMDRLVELSSNDAWAALRISFVDLALARRRRR